MINKYSNKIYLKNVGSCNVDVILVFYTKFYLLSDI